MPENAVRLLTVGILALVYLFFLGVMRVVWSEVRAGQIPMGRGAAAPAAAALTAAALTRLDAGGRPVRRYPVTGEAVLGRAGDCGIVLDEKFVSTHHARVRRDGDRMLVEDLGSTNGTWVDDRRIDGAVPVGLGQRVRIGSIPFEITP